MGLTKISKIDATTVVGDYSKQIGVKTKSARETTSDSQKVERMLAKVCADVGEIDFVEPNVGAQMN